MVRRPGKSRARGRKTRPKREAWVISIAKPGYGHIFSHKAQLPVVLVTNLRKRVRSSTPLSRESGHGAGPEPATQELGRPAPASLRATSQPRANLLFSRLVVAHSSRPFSLRFQEACFLAPRALWPLLPAAALSPTACWKLL